MALIAEPDPPPVSSTAPGGASWLPPLADGTSVSVTPVDEVGLVEFSARLRRVLAARGERVVFFDAADDAPYGRAVEVLDLARGGGATRRPRRR